MQDIVLIILGGICMAAGIAGCLLPVLPGPPISYAGLILLQLSSKQPFSNDFLITYGLLTAFVTILEQIIPIIGAKVFHGSKYGVWGSAIGLIAGIFIFPPFGILIGAFAGAFLGELAGGRNLRGAGKASIGSLIGFITGTVIKIVLSIIMAYHFMYQLFLV